MDYWDAVVLGVVEGLTEFLPVSSTGHLTIAEKLLGLDVDDPAVTGYTAVIQMGAIAAVIVYFARDIWRIIKAWTLGLVKSEYRGHLDHRMGWYVIVATIPVGVVGFLAQDLITGDLRSLWVVAVALIGWSAFMWLAERVATQSRPERDLGLRDAIAIGLAQAVSLIPGVSRSGATISVGLFRGLDRVTATRPRLPTMSRPSPCSPGRAAPATSGCTTGRLPPHGRAGPARSRRPAQAPHCRLARRPGDA